MARAALPGGPRRGAARRGHVRRQAAEALKKATAANPDHLRARLSLALARLYQGTGREEATKTVSDVLAREAELSPALKARARVVRAALALTEGNTDEALKEAGEALAASPDEHHALFIRARALALKKDAGARTAFQEAVAKRRTAPLLYLDGAKALQQAGDGEGALALLDALRDRLPRRAGAGPRGEDGGRAGAG